MPHLSRVLALLVFAACLAHPAASAGPRVGFSAGVRAAELTTPAFDPLGASLRPGLQAGVVARWTLSDHVRLAISPTYETVGQQLQFIDRTGLVTWHTVALPIRVDWGPAPRGFRLEGGVEPLLLLNANHTLGETVLSRVSTGIRQAPILERVGTFPGGGPGKEKAVSLALGAGVAYAFALGSHEGAATLRWSEGVTPIVDPERDMRRRTRAIELAFTWLR